MQKVKLGEIYRARGTQNGDGKLENGIEDLIAVTDIPARFGVHLARLGNRLMTEMQAIEKQRVKLVQQYGTEKDGNYQVEGENTALFVAEFDAMLDQEIEFMGKVQIPATKMIRGETQDICIPVGCLMNLDPFIEIVE
uniref:Uncharacterized protein n=1 Tax=viral metagenome TaxID=1070528 RepID=A0A6M3LA81_9ZZZZ